MARTSEFSALLRLFNAERVDYVIVGGYALAFHGSPRTTGDMDLLVRVTKDNAENVLRALSVFGFGSLNLSASDFTKPDSVVQLGYPPMRIDILTSLDGVTAEEVFAMKEAGEFDGVPTHFIGRSQLIANKRAVGRKRDLADLEDLGEEP